MKGIKWYDDNHLTIGDFPAYAIDGTQFMRQVDDYRDRLVIEKTRDMLRSYEALFEDKQQSYLRIIEIGIFMGGSSAYLHELFSPEKIVTMDIRKKPLVTLDNYIEARGINNSLKPRWGVDQGNNSQVSRVVNEEFGDQLIDLIIDDASHLLQPTRNTFNTLFPRLRPGGYYFIEDWKWAHGSPDTPTTGGSISAEAIEKALGNQPPLSLLGIDLMMACGNRPDIISEVHFSEYHIRIRRGSAKIDALPFDVRNFRMMHNIDKALPEDLPW